MRYIWKLAKPFINVYEGEGEGDAAAAEAAAAEAAAKSGSGEDEKPKFSQKQVNDMMAKHKGGLQKQVETQVAELSKLKQAQNLTEKQKNELQTRIEDLQNSLLSKEELAKKDQEKLRSEHKRERDMLSTDRDFYKSLYQRSTITRSISDEAVQAEAFNPRQVVALLEGKTRLVEKLGDDGQPIPGEFEVRVKMDDVADGKPTTLDLTVAEALKRMKDRADEYGNLFKSGVAGGLGGTSGKASKDFDPSKATPEEYRKWRNSRMGRDKK